MNLELQKERFEKCQHRSEEKKTVQIKHCCGRTIDVAGFWCEAKGILLDQPICWECPLYKEKI